MQEKIWRQRIYRRIYQKTNQKIYLCLILFSLVLFACKPPEDVPENVSEARFEISWKGMRAVELKVTAPETKPIAFIVRIKGGADQVAPDYSSIENKVSLQSRELSAGTHYMYTATHYGTADTLNTHIQGDTSSTPPKPTMATTDTLSPATDYTLYVFDNKVLVDTLEFSTLPVPAAADWGPGTQHFVDGTFPKHEGKYQIDVVKNSVALFPVYTRISDEPRTDTPDQLRAGLRVVSPTRNNFIVLCDNIISCLSSAGYSMVSTALYKTASQTLNTYIYSTFGIQNTLVRDSGQWLFKDDATGRERKITINVR